MSPAFVLLTYPSIGNIVSGIGAVFFYIVECTSTVFLYISSGLFAQAFYIKSSGKGAVFAFLARHK